MSSEGYCIANAIFVGILLNLIIPLLLAPFATEEERIPKKGISSLSLKGQFMHMMVRNVDMMKYHPLSVFIISLILALIIGLSVFLGYKLRPCERLVKLFK